MWSKQYYSSCMYIASSDGVGATGTFITIDHVLEQIERGNVVDIPGVIQGIRQQRMNMVDTVVCSTFLLSTLCYVCTHICTIAMVLPRNQQWLQHLHTPHDMAPLKPGYFICHKQYTFYVYTYLGNSLLDVIVDSCVTSASQYHISVPQYHSTTYHNLEAR